MDLSKRNEVEAILFGRLLFHQLPADGTPGSVMKLEECTVDEMLSGSKKDLELSVGDDASVKEFILRKDITRLVVFDTPGIEGIGCPISFTTNARGAWRWRGRMKRRRHGGVGMDGRESIATDGDRSSRTCLVERETLTKEAGRSIVTDTF